ncbi:MAG: hypothetical protein ACRD0U_04265 [Acidimicrobiales bacterium]
MKTGIGKKRHLLALAGAVVAIGMVVPATASTASPATRRGCRQAFDEAQRQDMESFRDYDAEAFREVHHDDALTVFASGTLIVYGADNIMATLHRHFEDQEAIWSWTELSRFIDNGCRTGYILYDTTYELPSVNFVQHATVGVSYLRDNGKWLVIADQGTLIPPPTDG